MPEYEYVAIELDFGHEVKRSRLEVTDELLALAEDCGMQHDDDFVRVDGRKMTERESIEKGYIE